MQTDAEKAIAGFRLGLMSSSIYGMDTLVKAIDKRDKATVGMDFFTPEPEPVKPAAPRAAQPGRVQGIDVPDVHTAPFIRDLGRGLQDVGVTAGPQERTVREYRAAGEKPPIKFETKQGRELEELATATAQPYVDKAREARQTPPVPLGQKFHTPDGNIAHIHSWGDDDTGEIHFQGNDKPVKWNKKAIREQIGKLHEEPKPEPSAPTSIMYPGGHRLPPHEVRAIHAGLQHIAGHDPDKARELNGIGFSKFDGDFGHSLANAISLSPRQAEAGLKLVRKYRRQLPSHVYDTLSHHIAPAEEKKIRIRRSKDEDIAGGFAAGMQKSVEPPVAKRLRVHGLLISIENPRGSIRTKKGSDGKTWSRRMFADYGRLVGKRAEGDEDQLDVFVGRDHNAPNAYVVQQLNKDGKADEKKIVLGVRSVSQARRLYLRNYPKGWKVGDIEEMPIEKFKEWIDSASSRSVKAIDKHDKATVGMDFDSPEHPEGHKDNPLKSSDVNFEKIKSLVGNSVDANHVLHVDNGAQVHAMRKCTMRNGLIHTKYLHTTIYKPNGHFEQYREQPNGDHRLVDSGKYSKERLETPETQRIRIVRKAA